MLRLCLKNSWGDIVLVSLISAGIDSPVSSYLVLKYRPVFLHFEQGNSLQYVSELVRVLGGGRLFSVKHKELMKLVKEFSSKKDICVYCKSGMLLVAEKLAEKLGCLAIVTGDSLGQVASQTILNLKSEEELIDIPVIRPLIGLDKVEIVDMAKKIGTYEISISFKEKCVYSPKHPVTSGCCLNPKFRDEVKAFDFNFSELVINP